ncbi:MAG TPA: alpha/beta fold hydrolase, partial [Candidatus Elarobacter sp.]
MLLHGMASNLTRWSEFLEQTTLKSEWNIVRPDLRGHGESIMRGRIGMEIWSGDLVELLDAEHGERAVFIGHSLGAHLALHFAARFPTRVRA